MRVKVKTAQDRYCEWQDAPSWLYLRRLNFEISSVCNLSCRYCSLRAAPRRKAFIDPHLVERVLGEVAGYDTSLREIGLYFSGESLLHPEFVSILERVKKCLPFFKQRPAVYLHTNGMLWNESRTNVILGMQVLDRIVLSIDGVNAESYERMRPGGNYGTVMDVFERLLDSRDRLNGFKVCVNNLVDDAALQQVVDPYLIALCRRADEVESHLPYDLNDGGRFGYYRHEECRGFCWYMLDTLIVTSDARVSLCCVDLNARNAFGNLEDERLADIYFGNRHRQILELMANGCRRDIAGCQQCVVGDNDRPFVFGEAKKEVGGLLCSV